MTIDLKQSLKNLKDEDLKDETGIVLTLGKALSNILLANETGDKMKLFLLAKKCFTEDSLEVDASDLNLIKEAVKTTKAYLNAIVTGQCEIILNEVKE